MVSALFKAAEVGDLDKVREVLKECSSVDVEIKGESFRISFGEGKRKSATADRSNGGPRAADKRRDGAADRRSLDKAARAEDN